MPFEEPASMTLKPSPFDIGPAHLVGIGGIGMSGIAEIMMNIGYKVQGSDVKDSANVERLREKGATVHIGHAAENVAGAGAVIISSAIKGGNPEVEAARAQVELQAAFARSATCVIISEVCSARAICG